MADDAQAGGVPQAAGQASSGAGIAATPQQQQPTATETQSQQAGQGGAQQQTQTPPAQAAGDKSEAGKQQQAASLTDDPKFKAWQASRDREANQLRQQFAQTQQQYTQAQQELEQLRLANADDGQKAAYYEQKAREMAQQWQAYQAQQQWTRWYANEAFETINSFGLNPADERLAEVLTDYAYASPQGIVALAKKCGQVLRADLTKAEREAVLERQRGRVEALNEAGVTQTSTGTGGTAPNADETKVREWKEKVARVRASGRATPETFAELLAEGKKLGITQ